MNVLVAFLGYKSETYVIAKEQMFEVYANDDFFGGFWSILGGGAHPPAPRSPQY